MVPEPPLCFPGPLPGHPVWASRRVCESCSSGLGASRPRRPHPAQALACLVLAVRAAPSKTFLVQNLRRASLGDGRR